MRHVVKLLHIIIISLLFAQICLADETQQKVLLEAANNAYHERDYILAADLYKQLLHENGYSAPLLYNLANTYAQNGEYGKAVVNYHRARLMDPGDPDIKGNLEAVSKKAGIFEQERPFISKLTNILTFNQWCLTGLFCFTIFVGSIAAALFLPVWKTAPRATAPLSLCAAVLSIYLAVISYHPYTSGIIILPETVMLISPHDKASTNGSIREGKQVHLIKEYNDFRYITESSGRSGWIPKRSVEAIIPDGSSLD